MKPSYAKRTRSNARVGVKEHETVFKKKVRGAYLKPASMTMTKQTKRRKRKGIVKNALFSKPSTKRKKNLAIDTSPSKRSKKTVEFADHE